MAPRILAVDDEQELLLNIKEILTHNGYDVTTADCGETALRAFKSQTPDLILTDVVMPGIGGFGFFKELLNDEQAKTLPVVVMTARGKMKDTFLALGARDVIAKPFEKEDFLQRIRAILPPGEASPELIAETEQAATEEAQPVSSNSATDTGPSGFRILDVEGQARLKALLAGPAPDVLEKIGSRLQGKSCSAMLLDKAQSVLDQTIQWEPDMIIMDVLLDGTQTKEVIRKIRKLPGVKAKKVLTFSYLEDNLPADVSKNQRLIDLESSKVSCMDAGADVFLGPFDEENFLAGLESHLS